VVHVLEWFTGETDLLNIPELQLDAAEDARARLQRLLPEAPDAGGVGLLVAAGTPHREILRVAREREADLVVLGAHRRRALDRSLPGIQLVHLLREASCAVLVVPTSAGLVADHS
jgi:nucleotide-binding universal stress UspA family protein